MKVQQMHELAESKREFIPVRSHSTGRRVLIDAKEWRSEGCGSMVWGQKGRNDETGWYFDIIDLEETD